ncbi:MAG: hypothetical protein IAE81_03350, partial [Caldilineaceae bacterium]|nr:hypothetical protein [Caldilineaceae bacterium]
AAPQPGQYRFSVRVYNADDAAATPLLTADGQAGVEIGPVEVVID